MNFRTRTITSVDAQIQKDDAREESIFFDEYAPGSNALKSKLDDASTPGFQAEFDPNEAEVAGAFTEDALSESDALDSTHDVPLLEDRSTPQKS
jgi:hypothetical protein